LRPSRNEWIEKKHLCKSIFSPAGYVEVWLFETHSISVAQPAKIVRLAMVSDKVDARSLFLCVGRSKPIEMFRLVAELFRTNSQAIFFCFKRSRYAREASLCAALLPHSAQ
jgi:hypothetical protein